MTNTMTTKFLSAMLAVTATTVSFAEIAHAADPEQVEFTYSPIELADTESAANLEKRLERFAARKCASSSPLMTPKMKRECREDIKAQLEAKIWNTQF